MTPSERFFDAFDDLKLRNDTRRRLIQFAGLTEADISRELTEAEALADKAAALLDENAPAAECLEAMRAAYYAAESLELEGLSKLRTAIGRIKKEITQ